MIANFNKNSSNYEYQSSSAIQGTSKGTESRKDETSINKGSQRVESRKNIKYNKSEGSCQVLSMMEMVYSKT